MSGKRICKTGGCEVAKLRMSITDTDLFQDILSILKELTEDERVSKELREEYMKMIKKTLDINSPSEYYF